MTDGSERSLSASDLAGRPSARGGDADGEGVPDAGAVRNTVHTRIRRSTRGVGVHRSADAVPRPGPRPVGLRALRARDQHRRPAPAAGGPGPSDCGRAIPRGPSRRPRTGPRNPGVQALGFRRRPRRLPRLPFRGRRGSRRCVRRARAHLAAALGGHCRRRAGDVRLPHVGRDVGSPGAARAVDGVDRELPVETVASASLVLAGLPRPPGRRSAGRSVTGSAPRLGWS